MKQIIRRTLSVVLCLSAFCLAQAATPPLNKNKKAQAAQQAQAAKLAAAKKANQKSIVKSNSSAARGSTPLAGKLNKPASAPSGAKPHVQLKPAAKQIPQAKVKPTYRKPVPEEEDDEEEEDTVASAGRSHSSGKLSPAAAAVYRLVIYRPGTRVKLSEAAVVAVSPEYVASSFDVIAELLDPAKELQAVLETQSGALNATLVEVDAINNLALLRVGPNRLTNYLERSQIRTGYPQTGEGLMIMGYFRSAPLVQWNTISVGTLNDGLLSGFRTQAAAKTVPAGSLVFDKERRWIGVLGRGENSIWSQAQMASAVFELLRRRTQPQPASVQGLRTTALGQYSQIQNFWMKALLSAESSTPLVSRNWTVGSTLKSFECQSEPLSLTDSTAISLVQRAEVQKCQNPLAVSGGAWVPSGFEIVTGTLKLKEPRIDEDQKLRFEEQISKTWKANYDATVSDASTYTSHDCQVSKIKNASGQAISVEYCTAAQKTTAGLNDWFVRLVAWGDQGDGAFVVSRLKGFELESVQRVIAKLAEDLRRSP